MISTADKVEILETLLSEFIYQKWDDKWYCSGCSELSFGMHTPGCTALKAKEWIKELK